MADFGGSFENSKRLLLLKDEKLNDLSGKLQDMRSKFDTEKAKNVK